MIELHRMRPPAGDLHLNADLIQTIEAHPDTVVTLTTGSRFVVVETPAQVVEKIRCWRASILATAAVMDVPAAESSVPIDHGEGRVLQFPPRA